MITKGISFLCKRDESDFLGQKTWKLKTFENIVGVEENNEGMSSFFSWPKYYKPCFTRLLSYDYWVCNEICINPGSNLNHTDIHLILASFTVNQCANSLFRKVAYCLECCMDESMTERLLKMVFNSNYSNTHHTLLQSFFAQRRTQLPNTHQNYCWLLILNDLFNNSLP